MKDIYNKDSTPIISNLVRVTRLILVLTSSDVDEDVDVDVDVIEMLTDLG